MPTRSDGRLAGWTSVIAGVTLGFVLETHAAEWPLLIVLAVGAIAFVAVIFGVFATGE